MSDPVKDVSKELSKDLSEDGGEPASGSQATGELSPRHVKAAARVLAKEAQKILKKHSGRIAAAPAGAIRQCIAEIEALRAAANEDMPGLERQAKRLDELLHRHASFARKSALRETAENIAIAVIIALGLRSCLYEPFKIPSSSMMPTLRAGDHIFVNKFIYGVQIPFTTTVVGESLGEVERGDVIVFRYPIDETEDFIKRVVGLAGDEVRVVGRQVAVKRAGESQFEVLPHERLQARCLDDAGLKEIANCTLYQETAGDKTYVVQYVMTPDERNDIGSPKPRIWKVPEGHLLVMGDNRNRSHDSLAWTVSVEAIRADRLLTSKDLRDLTQERLFEMRSAGDPGEEGEVLGADPHYDQVTYTASHRSEAHDLALGVWREPTLSAPAVFETLAARVQGATPTTLPALGAQAATAAKTRLAALAARVAQLVIGTHAHGRQAIVRLEEPAAVLELSCGSALCGDDAAFAVQLVDVLERLQADPEQEARLLLERSREATYSAHWSGRHNPKDHVFERRFAKGGEAAGPRAQVRLRAFREPEEGIELLRDAAQASAKAQGATVVPQTAPQGDDEGPQGPVDGGGNDGGGVNDGGQTGSERWLAQSADAWTTIVVDHPRDFVVVLECGKAVCRTEDQAAAMATTVTTRIGPAATDRRRMVELLGPKDVEGIPEVPIAAPALYEFDDVRLEATIQDAAHSIELEAWLKPESGLASKVAAVRDTVGGLAADDSVADGGYYGETTGETTGHTFVFGVPSTDVVIRLTCHPGLCADKATAQALAQRAASTALDTSTFVDPDAERPKPFVPRGNVKGRAERIWLPFSRFWLAIR